MRELREQFLEPSFVLADIRINLTPGAFEVDVAHDRRAAVTGAAINRKAIPTAARLIAMPISPESSSLRRPGRSTKAMAIRMRTFFPSAPKRATRHSRICACLYGGSVKPANASEIPAAAISSRRCLALPEVGGALVGGASLKAADFEAIFRAVSAPIEKGDTADRIPFGRAGDLRGDRRSSPTR